MKTSGEETGSGDVPESKPAAPAVEIFPRMREEASKTDRSRPGNLVFFCMVHLLIYKTGHCGADDMWFIRVTVSCCLSGILTGQ